MSLEVSKEIGSVHVVSLPGCHDGELPPSCCFGWVGRDIFRDSDSSESVRRSALLLNDLDPREIQGVEVQSAGLGTCWGLGGV